MGTNKKNIYSSIVTHQVSEKLGIPLGTMKERNKVDEFFLKKKGVKVEMKPMFKNKPS